MESENRIVQYEPCNVDNRKLRRRKVIVFGETGKGKTSMLNAITGEAHKTKNSLIGTTFENVAFKPIKLSNDDLTEYTFIDTAGLGEGDGGKFKHFQAMLQLMKLVAQTRRGFNLLILVISADKLNECIQRNYKLFVEVMFENKLPCLLVISNMDRIDEDWDSWLKNNMKNIRNYGICVMDDQIVMSVWKPAPYGMQYNSELMTEFVEKSVRKIKMEIRRHSLDTPVALVELHGSIYAFIVRVCNFILPRSLQKPIPRDKDTFEKVLQSDGIRLTSAEAKQVVKEIKAMQQNNVQEQE